MTLFLLAANVVVWFAWRFPDALRGRAPEIPSLTTRQTLTIARWAL